MTPRKKHIFLYGPPGSGKTTVGRTLADNLGLPFVDIDTEIEASEGKTITTIMRYQGEAAFRALESSAIAQTVHQEASVVSLGGGALLSQTNRDCVEAVGEVILLEASLDTLVDRLSAGAESRPLLAGDLNSRLNELMERRMSHYSSFALRVANYSHTPQDTALEIQTLLGRFHIGKVEPGYNVIIHREGILTIGETVGGWNIPSPVAIVTDSNVGPLHARSLQASLQKTGLVVSILTIPAGEQNKTLDTITNLWREFLQIGLDRKSLVFALGGGVTGDLTGFAASTYMRGIAWVGIPTSLLAMVDSSLGGKTGFDLPYGKNLVGAFHSPRLVVSDPDILSTLPEAEFRSGLAEALKHGIIAEPRLFELCRRGENGVRNSVDELIRRAVAVKIKFIEADPFERGIRAGLNYGHTVGHALELASGFHLRHGEAIAIGMVAEANLAEKLSLAEKGLAMEIAGVVAGLGLPTAIPPELSREAIAQAMHVDKKKQAGQVRFALPVRIGEVKTNVEIDDLNLIFEEE